MQQIRVLATRGVFVVALAAAHVAALRAQEASKPLPLKYAGPPTVPAITAGDLMTRLYKYADDSMMGRYVGSRYHLMATSYIESEVRRLGLTPGGDNGGYFQNIHVVVRGLDSGSTLIVGERTYKAGSDFIATSSGTANRIDGVPVIYWGSIFDSVDVPKPDAFAGKVMAIRIVPTPAGLNIPAFVGSQMYQDYLKARSLAAGFINIAATPLSDAQVARALNPPDNAISLDPTQQGLVSLTVSPSVAEAILGAPPAAAKRSTEGKPVTAAIRFTERTAPGRNVIAILPGSDPRLKGEFVAIGAHNDHVGYAGFGQCGRSMASDSQHIWNAYGRPAGAEGGRDLQKNPITPDEWTAINAKTAELRKTIPERPDSICNGADDDGSGTVSVLEIAEQFARGPVKPKRSILFVWHAGEELGMWGSGYFTDHPTVSRDSIVAQLNIDMVGRGAASDVTGQTKGPTDSAGRVTGPGEELHGGDRYLQLVGSRRLSTELGDLVEKVNADKRHGFNFDYHIDADGHQQNIYCRSDHWSYAKWGIPVVFFTTGGHADYHQVTDEPQYIRYGAMAAVDSLIFDIAVRVADLDHRVVVDHPKPNPAPATVCKQ